MRGRAQSPACPCPCAPASGTVCRSLLFFPLGLLCVLPSPIQKVESYRSPGRKQQEQLRVQRAWRPHSLRRSEHEPKECAGSLLRRGRVPNVAFEWPLFAVGKRARPGKALKHLQGTVFSAEALSRPARPAFLLPFCCRRTPLVGSRCGQRSASSLPFCCRRTPLVSFLFLSAAGASA